jgi:hypothetical protein
LFGRWQALAALLGKNPSPMLITSAGSGHGAFVHAGCSVQLTETLTPFDTVRAQKHPCKSFNSPKEMTHC